MKINKKLKKTLLCSSVFLYTVIKFFAGNPDSEDSQYMAAYLDPGTGTMIISAIVGIFATVALGVKTFWYKIAQIFRPANKNVSPADRDDQK
jgi:hypothetical protein